MEGRADGFPEVRKTASGGPRYGFRTCLWFFARRRRPNDLV